MIMVMVIEIKEGKGDHWRRRSFMGEEKEKEIQGGKEKERMIRKGSGIVKREEERKPFDQRRH